MKLIIIIIFGILTTGIQAQSFKLKLAQDENPFEITDGKAKGTFEDKVDTILITCTSTGFKDKTFKLSVGGKVCMDFKGDANDVPLVCPDITDLRNKQIQILDAQSKPVPGYSFIIESAIQKGTDTDNKIINAPLIDEVSGMFPKIALTQYGLKIPADNKNTIYRGSNYIHIFADQFGNNIFSTIPQGISNRQYVVHIFYLTSKEDPGEITYSVNQLEGEFQEALVFNNAGQIGTLDLFSGRTGKEEKWEHKEFLLSTSTTDIKFEIVRTSLKDKTDNKFEIQVLKTYTIKMSKVYHGSFDIGLINSTLENPEFQLLSSPVDPTKKVVKKMNGGNRGIVTAMATFYTSPVILIETLFDRKNKPLYQLTGRNFLEDHKIYERIYPSIGVSLSDNTLDNLFFGFNWEFARGGALFVGYHYGKVNVYDGGNNFSFGGTPVTEAEFDLHQNTAWKTSFAMGLKLDLLIVRNLIMPASSQ